MGLPPLGGSDEGISLKGGEYLYRLATKHGVAVYCDASNTRPLHGGVSEARGAVSKQWWDQSGIDLAGARESAM